MRIVLVSTYPPIECGIGTYTDFLVQSLTKTPNEIQVISQFGSKGENVHPAWNTDSENIAKNIYNIATRITPDLVHIQHEFGLYGELNGISVLELIYRIKSTGTPVIATFHTVNVNFDFRQKMIFKTMCRELDGIIVHEEEHEKTLKEYYKIPSSKIYHIPHGAREMEPIPNAKKKLKLEGKKVILLAGYFRPSKNFDKIVDLFPRIAEKVPNAWLVLSGKLRLMDFSEYRQTLFEKINNSPVKDRIEVFRGQFPQYTFDTILSASDIMVFPYSAGAQSGVMAHAFTFGKPVVTSVRPAYLSVLEKSGAGSYAISDNEYVDRISELLTNKELHLKCSENAKRYVKKVISWDIVAQKTLQVYKKFDQKLECKTRYVYVHKKNDKPIINTPISTIKKETSCA